MVNIEQIGPMTYIITVPYYENQKILLRDLCKYLMFFNDATDYIVGLYKRHRCVAEYKLILIVND